MHRINLTKTYNLRTKELLKYCYTVLTIRLLCILFMTGAITNVYAGFEGRSEQIFEQLRQAGNMTSEPGVWVPVPIPVSNPTVGTGLQAVLMYLYPKENEQTPNATSGVAAMYTDSESWFIGGFHDDNFSNDQYRLNVIAGYGVFNIDFYGIGETPFPDGVSLPYEFKGAMASLKFLSRLPGTENWYGGVQYLYLDSRITFESSAISPLLPDVTGNFRTAALGGLLTYDSRDDNYYPTQGQHSEFKYMEFGETWGGDFEYNKFIGYYNAYIPIEEKLTLAVSTRVETSTGDTPFFNLAYLDMRGFARGRYQDQHSLSLHAEGRYKFAPRWGMIAFYETGWISDNFSQITSGRKVASTGAGLRWQVTKDKTMNLGLDVAFSTDDQAIYVQIGESY